MASKETVQKEKNDVAPKTENKKKRMVSVSFTGKELLNNTFFDTTFEEIAKSSGIFDSNRKYGPLDVIIGEKELLDLVEKEIERMEIGEEKAIKLMPKDAFGERQSDLVRVVPIKSFSEQKINPVPGLIIRAGDAMGKVQSVSGGRVRVDFNHPLAGREIEYVVKVEREISNKKEVAQKIFDKYYKMIPGAKEEIKEDILYITLPAGASKNLKIVNETIAKLAKQLGVEIKFVEKKEVKKETENKAEKSAETKEKIDENEAKETKQ